MIYFNNSLVISLDCSISITKQFVLDKPYTINKNNS